MSPGARESLGRRTNKRLQALVVVVGLLALVALTLLPIEDLLRAPATMLIMVTLAVVAGQRPIRIPAIRTAVSASDPFLFVSIAILGGAPAVLVGCASIVSSAIAAHMRLGWQKLIFNLSATVLSVSAASWVFERLSSDAGGGLQRTLPLVAATTVYFLVSASLVTAAISIDQGKPFFATWTKSAGWTAVTNYLGTTLAVGLMFVFELAGPAGFVLGLPPLWFFLTYYRIHRDRIREQQSRMDQIVENNQRLEQQVQARTEQLANKVAELERAKEHLKELADTDELTLLPNRRRFRHYLNRELLRAKRFGHDLSLLVVDIDHFKKINDGYGHSMGDLVLQQFANVMDHNIRAADLAARYGGEEFAIVLAETPKSGALVMANHLRETVAEQNFGAPDQDSPEQVTISIGVATFPEDATEVDELITIADRRLYQAKEKGRNLAIA